MSLACISIPSHGVVVLEKCALADPGGASDALAPQQDPILSFLHKLLPKSTHVAGWCPQRVGGPPTGNPGSATGVYVSKPMINHKKCVGFQRDICPKKACRVRRCSPIMVISPGYLGGINWAKNESQFFKRNIKIHCCNTCLD